LKIREGIVPSRFAVLSKFGVKFVEVAGAGLASALCACCLGQIGQQPVPPIVQVLPASEDAIRMARDDHALLAALARKDADAAAKPEHAAPALAAASAPAPKPAKPAQSAQARRNQKAEQPPGEPRPRSTEPLPIQPPIAAANSAPRPVTQGSPAQGSPAQGSSVQASSVQASSARASPTLLGRDGFTASAPNPHEEERPLLARLEEIPSWFMPDNDRIFGDVPRPPMPVGEFFHSPM
jgi:hypothetical protein